MFVILGWFSLGIIIVFLKLEEDFLLRLCQYTALTCWRVSLNSYFIFWDVHLRGDEEMLWVLALHCCEKRCLRQLSIDDERYTEARKQTGKQNYFLEVLHQQSHRNESGEYETEFYVWGKAVCREAWLHAHNLSKDSFRHILKKFKRWCHSGWAWQLGEKVCNEQDCRMHCLFTVLCELCWRPSTR